MVNRFMMVEEIFARPQRADIAAQDQGPRAARFAPGYLLSRLRRFLGPFRLVAAESRTALPQRSLRLGGKKVLAKSSPQRHRGRKERTGKPIGMQQLN
jgi:hypothetical protein